METGISTEGILTVKALVMTKRIFEQIEKACGNRDGELIGYVMGDLGDVWFIGKENGKLYRTRHDFMIITMMDSKARLKNRELVGYSNQETAIAELKGKLPQIFLK